MSKHKTSAICSIVVGIAFLVFQIREFNATMIWISLFWFAFAIWMFRMDKTNKAESNDPEPGA